MELSELLLNGLLLATLAGALGMVGWSVYRGNKRSEWEAAHPHPEVEPPQRPRGYRFIDADKLEAEQEREVDAYFARSYGCPGAGDRDPQVGDVVSAYVLWDRDGELVAQRVAARVLWPRESYVRAHLMHSDGPTTVMDIPRSALAGIYHLTAA